MQKHRIDPMFIIFEKHLYDNAYDSTDDFLFAVVGEYMDYLRENSLIMPDKQRDEIIEVLMEDVRDMLLKKLYGCSSLNEYRKEITKEKENDRKLARERYSVLKKLV